MMVHSCSLSRLPRAAGRASQRIIDILTRRHVYMLSFPFMYISLAAQMVASQSRGSPALSLTLAFSIVA
jgi:hypothetical protein